MVSVLPVHGWQHGGCFESPGRGAGWEGGGAVHLGRGEVDQRVRGNRKDNDSVCQSRSSVAGWLSFRCPLSVTERNRCDAPTEAARGVLRVCTASLAQSPTPPPKLLLLLRPCRREPLSFIPDTTARALQACACADAELSAFGNLVGTSVRRTLKQRPRSRSNQVDPSDQHLIAFRPSSTILRTCFLPKRAGARAAF